MRPVKKGPSHKEGKKKFENEKVRPCVTHYTHKIHINKSSNGIFYLKLIIAILTRAKFPMKPGGFRLNEVDAGLFHIEKNSRKIYGAVEYIYRVDAISVCELWTGLPEVLGGGRSLLWVVYFILKRLQNLI